MKYYSQKSKLWGINRLGTCSDTLSQSGCVVTSLGMLAEITPDDVNELLKAKKGYVDGCIVNWAVAARLLGLKYSTNTKKPLFYPCIAETDHYKSKGVPQHFFIILADGRIVDPLDVNPQPKTNPYNIVSYRNIYKENNMDTYKGRLSPKGKIYEYSAENWYKSAKRYYTQYAKLLVDYNSLKGELAKQARQGEAEGEKMRENELKQEIDNKIIGGSMLNGQKTYLAAIILAVYAIGYIGFYEGSWGEVPKLLSEALGLAGIRSALDKIK